MAATIRGIVPLSYGTSVTTGFVTESTTEDQSTEEVLVEDEIGDVVTQVVNIGVKTETTLEVMPKSGATLPNPGDVLTYGAFKCVIITISKKRIKKDVEKWTIKGNRFPNITI